MTNIPDLTNAEPGDVYQGPDGRLWHFLEMMAPLDSPEGKAVHLEAMEDFMTAVVSRERFLREFKKVE